MPRHNSQHSCNHTTCYDLPVSAGKEIQGFCTRREEPGRSPSHCHLQRLGSQQTMGSGTRATLTISMPKQKNNDFEACFERNFKRKFISTKMKNSCQSTMSNFHAATAKQSTTLSCNKNIPHAAPAATNIDAATFHGDLHRLNWATQ